MAKDKNVRNITNKERIEKLEKNQKKLKKTVHEDQKAILFLFGATVFAISMHSEYLAIVVLGAIAHVLITGFLIIVEIKENKRNKRK